MPDRTTLRALPLDALRGLAIFLMILSSSIPFQVLPDWMYHAQLPPPSHTFIPTLPGITWVDLVFPFFLFSMGAAIPFALGRRLAQGLSRWRITLGLAERGLLLAAFAIYDEHIRPWRLNGGFENIPAWIDLIGLLGFFLLIPMFMQFPKSWPRWLGPLLRAGGWIGAIVFMALIRYPDGSGFALGRSDIIILVLANMAFFAAILWLVTNTNLLLRVGLLVLLIAFRVSSGTDGWVHDMWGYSPASWLFRFDFLKYLFIVLPGTIVGDLYVHRLHHGKEASRPDAWSTNRLVAIVGMMLLLIVTILVGMKLRLVVEATIVSLGLLVLAGVLLRSPGSDAEKLETTLFRWGAFLLMLGLFFEPFEGGIKKDPSTLSYYFVTDGLAIAALIALMVLIDRLGKARWLRLFIDSGQNPLVAYAGINNLIRPLLGITGIGIVLDAIFQTPWLGVIKGILVTTLVCGVAALFTRWKIFLKT